MTNSESIPTSSVTALSSYPRRTGKISRLLDYLYFGLKVHRSPYFDISYYRRFNPDIPANWLAASAHYALHGWREGRNPSAFFHTGYFVQESHFQSTLSGGCPLFSPLTSKASFRWPTDLPFGDHVPSLEEAYTHYPEIINKRSIHSACPRVAAYTHSMELQGAPRSLLELLTALSASGTIYPIIFYDHEGPLLEEYLSAGLRTVKLPPVDWSKDISRREVECRLRRQSDFVAKEAAPDIVLGNTIYAWWLVDGGLQRGYPCVWIIRESEEPFIQLERENPYIRYAAQCALRRADAVVFVSQFCREKYRDYDVANRHQVIHNGFPSERFTGIDKCQADEIRQAIRRRLGCPEETQVFLSVGTICAGKGQLDLLEAYLRLRRQGERCVHVWMLGDPADDYGQALVRRAAQLPDDLRAGVQRIPATTDVMPYYLAADYFVHCARMDSFPKVIQEAAYMDLPTLTTQVGGITEMISDGQTGIFYRPGDIRDLSSKMLKWLRCPESAQTLATAAREALSIFSFPDMLAKYQEIVHGVQ